MSAPRLIALFLLCLTCYPAWAGETQGISETIERIKPSIVVVGVYNKLASPPFQMRGTGFVMGNGNQVATNAHVLPETTDSEARLSVLIPGHSPENSQLRPAAVTSKDIEHDLAVLSITGKPLPALRIVNSDSVREGQAIAFTGFPIGGALGFSPVTHRGMVSSITPIVLPSGNSRQLNPKLIQQMKRGAFQIFQLDATAYPGNSGSPVFDITSGEVIGVINMVLLKGLKESALTHPSGISYAIPANFLGELSRQLPP